MSWDVYIIRFMRLSQFFFATSRFCNWIVFFFVILSSCAQRIFTVKGKPPLSLFSGLRFLVNIEEPGGALQLILS